MNFGRSIRINKTAVIILISCAVIIYYFYHDNSQNKSTNSIYLKNSNEINLRKLLIGSINAAQKGGIEILNISKQSDINKQSKGKTKEGADDPVTDADKKSHCVMSYGLRRIFPNLKIISEEDDKKNNNKICSDVMRFDLDPTVLHESAIIPDEVVNVKDVKVWIDPLDATQEYTEKLYEYVTTMVCVTIKGKPIIGVIHNPFTQKTTWAWVNKAVSEDLISVKKVEDEMPTRNPIVIVSRSHAGNVKNISKVIFGENTHITVAAGAGYKVLQVVFNNATAYLHITQIKKWDICAGNAILNALGGKMTNLQNEEIDYSNKKAVVNDKGLLSTLNNHEMYIRKLMLHKILQ